MITLMRSSTGIDDISVVRDIRRASMEIGRQANQDTADIRSQIDTLENRARLAQRAPVPTAAVQGATQTATATTPERPAAAAQERQTSKNEPTPRKRRKRRDARRITLAPRPNSVPPAREGTSGQPPWTRSWENYAAAAHRSFSLGTAGLLMLAPRCSKPSTPGRTRRDRLRVRKSVRRLDALGGSGPAKVLSPVRIKAALMLRPCDMAAQFYQNA